MINFFAYRLSDSYTSLKLIRQRYLLSQIQIINNKKVKSPDDVEALRKLEKELKPIKKFLDEARYHRDAILKEIGRVLLFIIYLVLVFGFLGFFFFFLLMYSQFRNGL